MAIKTIPLSILGVSIPILLGLGFLVAAIYLGAIKKQKVTGLLGWGIFLILLGFFVLFMLNLLDGQSIVLK